MQATPRPSSMSTDQASSHKLPLLAASPGRATLFLADLHLSPSIPRTVSAFERFIDGIDATDVGQVYILGDLFEFWIGDDMMTSPFTAAVVARLASLRERGIRLFVMHGNRDFLLGKRFAQAAGAQLIDDPTLFEGFGRRWLLTHGDALCTDDMAYQRFRATTRKRWIQCFFLRWPLRLRTRIAANMRAKSEQAGPARMHITDVNRDAVAALFDASGVDGIIQGHTHRPATHDETRNGQARTRWVLADWEMDATPPRGGYLRLDEHGLHAISLATLPRP